MFVGHLCQQRVLLGREVRPISEQPFVKPVG